MRTCKDLSLQNLSKIIPLISLSECKRFFKLRRLHNNFLTRFGGRDMKQTTYNVIRTTHKKSLVSWYVYERLGKTWHWTGGLIPANPHRFLALATSLGLWAIVSHGMYESGIPTVWDVNTKHNTNTVLNWPSLRPMWHVTPLKRWDKSSKGSVPHDED